ncbi:MAG: hypothetical protein JO215_13470, partial [Ktedonobacteraceae bacterium]|nr:hypothetical protein [Ktedonobacteraceae bacterium]
MWGNKLAGLLRSQRREQKKYSGRSKVVASGTALLVALVLISAGAFVNAQSSTAQAAAALSANWS